MFVAIFNVVKYLIGMIIMKKFTGVFSAFVLAAGMVGGVNAMECEDASTKVGSAIEYLDDAKVTIKGINLRPRFGARKALRRANIDVLKAKVAVAKCGVLPLDSNFVDMRDLDDGVLQSILGLRIYPASGHVTTEAALSMSGALIVGAIVGTYGPLDVGASLQIKAATALLERVELKLLQ